MGLANNARDCCTRRICMQSGREIRIEMPEDWSGGKQGFEPIEGLLSLGGP